MTRIIRAVVGRKLDPPRVRLHPGALAGLVELPTDDDGSGAVVARFVYGTRGNVPESMVKGGATYRLIPDHLGSVRSVVETTSAAIAHRIDYDASGRTVLDTSPGLQPCGFAGGLHDPQTGLVRFGARDLDPKTSRWTAKDPIGFAGGDQNLYAYV
jgi:RHS repeat-associated protein